MPELARAVHCAALRSATKVSALLPHPKPCRKHTSLLPSGAACSQSVRAASVMHLQCEYVTDSCRAAPHAVQAAIRPTYGPSCTCARLLQLGVLFGHCYCNSTLDRWRCKTHAKSKKCASSNSAACHAPRAAATVAASSRSSSSSSRCQPVGTHPVRCSQLSCPA